jgi:hypothetical protein
MRQNEQALVAEFVRLRHGWGLAATNLRERVGPHLIDLCGIEPDDNDVMIRRKVRAKIRLLCTHLPGDDQLAADIALGASPDAQHRLLGQRIDIIAHRLNCADRTARRRVDRAFERVAGEAVTGRALGVDGADTDPEKGWYVRHFASLLRLDTHAPEVAETRTIVALRPNLKKIAIRFSLPAQGEIRAPRDLYADVTHGARIESVQREGEEHFRFVLDLPRPIARDEAHTYTIVFRLPDGQSMRPHYALVPLVHLDSFEVRVRFHPDRSPRSVWRLDRLAPRTLADRRVPAGRQLPLDDACEVITNFDRMEQGFGYGVAWKIPGDVGFRNDQRSVRQ